MAIKSLYIHKQEWADGHQWVLHNTILGHSEVHIKDERLVAAIVLAYLEQDKTAG